MQEEKIIAPPEITQNEQAVSKIETNDIQANSSHFKPSRTSDVDNVFKSISYTKPKKDKAEKQKLSPEAKEKREQSRLKKEAIRGISYDKINGSATIKKGNLTLFIDQYNSDSFSGLSLSTTKTLDRIKTEYTDKGERKIRLHISEFANRGIKDKGKLKETISQDVANLYHLSLAYSKDPKNVNYLKLTRILETVNIEVQTTPENNPKISFFHGDYLELELSSRYAAFLDNNSFSQVDDRAYLLDNPNAYAIYARFLGNLSMNQGTLRGFVVPINTLQNACPEIQSKEEMRAIGDRHFEKRTERTIKALESIKSAIPDFEYRYCNKAGKFLSEEEAKQLQEKDNDEQFSNGYVFMKVNNFPYNEKKMKKNRKQLEKQPPEEQAKKPKKQAKS